MSRLPAVSGKQLIAALERLGFEVVRQKGSHCFLRHPDGRVTVVPVHRGESIGRGLMAPRVEVPPFSYVTPTSMW